jgi:hypothetical protein
MKTLAQQSRRVTLPPSLLQRTLRAMTTVAPLCGFLLLGTPVRADEVRLDDGRVLVGKVVEKGDALEITTTDGVVLVPVKKVIGRRLEADLRAELAKKARSAGDTAFAHLHLAIEARSYGLATELWQHLDRAIELQNETQASRLAANAGRDGTEVPAARDPLQRRIEDFLAQLEPELLPRKWRAADTRVRVHQLLDQLRSGFGPGKTTAIEELLVREPNADQELRTEARRNPSERRRICALAALMRREIAGNEHFVLRTAVLDGSNEVRDAAIELVREQGHDAAEAVQYMAPGLMHGSSRIRIRTAEAFAGLGHPDAVKLLVLAGPNAGKALASADTGVRGHVAFLNQQAYIRDFDVEIASAAFIADPKVDTLQSGVVLDVNVAGVFEEVRIVRAYQLALKQLTRSDPGANPRVWTTWLAGLVEQAPAAKPAPTTPARGNGR